MIMANFVLFMTCLQIVIIGADSQVIVIVSPISSTKIAQECETIVHKKCEEAAVGSLIKIALDLPVCRLLCYTKLSDGTIRATLTWIPNFMPCLVGKICKEGKCIFDQRIEKVRK
uniref:Putative salp15 n=1 Tax=Ixodes ricinus TaxID=34613 RepID=A0A0K8R4J2_IXORI